jgi:hypothetical protein
MHPADEPHEGRDVHRGRAVGVMAAFFALAIVSVVALWLVFGVRDTGFAAARSQVPFAAEGELGQREQLAAYRKAQTNELERLAWTDGSRQYAKIPIEDAIALLADGGRPK